MNQCDVRTDRYDDVERDALFLEDRSLIRQPSKLLGGVDDGLRASDSHDLLVGRTHPQHRVDFAPESRVAQKAQAVVAWIEKGVYLAHVQKSKWIIVGTERTAEHC